MTPVAEIYLKYERRVFIATEYKATNAYVRARGSWRRTVAVSIDGPQYDYYPDVVERSWPWRMIVRVNHLDGEEVAV